MNSGGLREMAVLVGSASAGMGGSSTRRALDAPGLRPGAPFGGNQPIARWQSGTLQTQLLQPGYFSWPVGTSFHCDVCWAPQMMHGPFAVPGAMTTSRLLSRDISP